MNYCHIYLPHIQDYKPTNTQKTKQGNLLSLHSPKYSGLANTKTIDVAAGKRGIVLTTQKKKTSKQMPAKRIAKQDLTWGISRTVKSVKGSAEYYRSDLVDVNTLYRTERI